MARNLQPCGTPAAARRHRRNKEPVCGKCRAAEAKRRDEQRTLKVAKEAPQVSPQIVEAVRVLDREEELREMYAQLSVQMGAAPAGAVASIARQRLEVLKLLTESSARPVSEGDMDELAKRRKVRGAAS